jgi:peptide-methionine (R)-S-oxide reductase
MQENNEKSEEDWRKILTKDQFHILRNKGTERAFTGKYWNHFEKGVYQCVGCGEKLFDSDTKYDSSCGWPSFTNTIENSVETEIDTSFGMNRTEVLCKTCGGHLGHVFNDGPKDAGGLRYCINSLALKFVSKDS